MDEKWICIKGKKILGRSFIHSFDCYQIMNYIFRHGGQSAFDRFNHLGYVVKEITKDYMDGEDSIADGLKGFFKRNGMEIPTERKLPEALEELFEQMQTILRIDLTEILDVAAEFTEREYQQIQDERQKEQQRLEVIHSLAEKNGIVGSAEISDKIHNLLALQKAKAESPDYELKELETAVALLWCGLLAVSLFSDTITHGQMLGLVECHLADECEISKLLESYGMEEDYEWYSENLIGCELSYPTKIKMKDILTLCTERVNEVLGINFEEY